MRRAGRAARGARAVRGRLRGDRGSVLLLTVGFALVAATAVVVVADTSAAFLQRRALVAAADAAALAGAQAVDEAVLYPAGLPPRGRVPLDPRAAEEAVRDHLARTRAAAPEGLAVEAVAVAGDAVSVTLRAPLHPPFSGLVAPGQVVRATATAALRIVPAAGR